MEQYFERKIYGKMKEWKTKYAPEYALFLKGARRVGKSTLVQKLGEEEYKSYIIIRFDKVSTEIKNLFVDSLEDLDNFFNILEFTYKTKLYPRESLIILDEIQLFKEARQALKTLLEDGRFDYLETGSLAGIEKTAPNILIPSEEYALDVLPMDFEEYLWANGEYQTLDIIKDHYETKKEFGSQLLKEIKKRFREYLCVGGMPQAVKAYIKTKDYRDVDFIKQNILNLYRQDMEVQQEENSEHVINFFDRIPTELSKHDKKYMLSHLDKNARIRDYYGAIKWLSDAKIINIAQSISEITPAVNLVSDDKSYKCYMQDTGLLISLTYRNRNYLDNELYENILKDKLHVNEGMVVENIVAQSLKANGHNLFFYRAEDKENKKKYEVDFVLRGNKKMKLLEVKSGDKETLKSLKHVKKQYEKSISDLLVLYDGEIKKEDGIIYYPYFVCCVL